MVKPVDAWWTVLVIDPVATRIVPPLARRTAITPTHITVVAHVLGFVSAVLFANGHLVAGAVVFELRFFGDCLDGKVARVRGTSSVLGRELDAWGDRIIVLTNFAAIGWGVAPLATLVVVGAYPVSFHLLDVRDRVLRQNHEAPPHETLRDRGYGAAMARRRLYPMPTPIEAEHLALFVAPLLTAFGIDLIGAAMWAVAAFFALQAMRYLASTLRAGASIDRQATSG